MAVTETLMGALTGGSFAILGGWLGARWQAGEARRVRQEQYSRDDDMRLVAERREHYVQFARAADPDTASDDPDSMIMHLDRLAWEIKLIGSPEVAKAARDLVDALDDSDHDPGVHWQSYEKFVIAFRRELFPNATQLARLDAEPPDRIP